jgi:hypothetical protein
MLADVDSSNRALTSIIQNTPFCPVLDDHSQWPHTIIDLDVQIDHARVLEGSDVVDIHIARQLQLRVPDFYYPDLGRRDAYDAFHAIWVMSVICGLLYAR